jgi:hypothetical protein
MKATIPALSLWAAVVLAACAGTDGSDAMSTVLREGEARLVRGDLVGARAAFMAATERDARCFVGWIGLARSLGASGMSAVRSGR